MSEVANYTIYIFRSSAEYVNRDFHLIVDGILLYRPLCIRQVCFSFLFCYLVFPVFLSLQCVDFRAAATPHLYQADGGAPEGHCRQNRLFPTLPPSCTGRLQQAFSLCAVSGVCVTLGWFHCLQTKSKSKFGIFSLSLMRASQWIFIFHG